MKYGQGPDTPSNLGPIDQPAPMDSAGQERPKSPGTGIDWITGRECDAVAMGAGSRTIHAKANRSIAGRHQIGSWCIEYLCGLHAYLLLTGKEGIGVRRAQFIDWTGARPNWKKRLREGQAEALEYGYIELIPSSTGHAVDLSEKGKRLIEEYDRRYKEIVQDMRERRIRAMIEREARDLKRRQKKAA